MSWGEVLEGLRTSSWSAAVLILTALFLRTLFRDRTPRWVFCLLWDLTLARLLIWGALTSPVSVWQWAVPPSHGQVAAGGLEAGPKWMLPIGEAAAALPGTAVSPAAVSPEGSAVLTAVWLTAALALAAWFLWGHLRFRRLCADSLPCGDDVSQRWLAAHPLCRRLRIRTSDRVAAPLTYGVLHPVILLPAGVDWTDRTALSWVLEHEYQHIRRFDALRKGLLAAALCLHWFNPLVWVMDVLCNRDMELACDEAVTAAGADRAGYARTLLSLEEQRGYWGPSGSHFSQNAMEERIRSIMKQKHFSKTALVVVFGIMTVVATVFASAAPERAPEAAFVHGHFQAVKGDVVIRSGGGEDGERQYSMDGGETWLSEEECRDQYGIGDWQVEWWSAGDYAAWLEEEKRMLQSMIGERGCTSGEGWFTWDQERVDEAVVLYEGILKDIRNGALYSKSITDQNGAVVEAALGSGTLGMTEISSSAEEDAAMPEAVDETALLEELKAFGIDASDGRLTCNGRRIRRLVDGVSVGDTGYSIRYLYSDPDGAVDVHTLRSAARNPDGSYDPMGALIGVAAEGEAGFDHRLVDSAVFSGGLQTATAEGSGGTGGMTFEERFAQYAPYGLVYAPRESGMGGLTWNGQDVVFFADQKPGGSVFSYQDPRMAEGLRVYAEYDKDGRLTGLRGE